MQILFENTKITRKAKKHFFNNLLEVDFSLKSKELSGKIIELYMVFILLIYPLFLFRDNWMGIPVKLLLYYAVTVITFLAAVILALEQRFEFRKPKELLDYIVLVYGGYNLLLMLVRIGSGKDYRQNLLCMGLAVAFYMLASGFSWYRYYTDLFLVSGTIVMLWLLIYYLIRPEFAAAGILLSNQQARSAYVLLVAVVAGAEYIQGRQKENDIFYLVVVGAAFFLLFLGQSRSFWMLGLCSMTVMPIFFRETAEHVRRSAVLIFLYLFLYSNMSLISSYSSLLREETSFHLMSSVYLDIALATAGVFFFHFWDKIPENVDLENWMLPGVWKICRWSLAFEGIFMIMAVSGAKRLTDMGKDGVKKSLCDFAVGLSEELRQGQNAFLDALADTGVIGAGILVILVIALAERGRSKADRGMPDFLNMVGLLFLSLLFIMPISEAVTPIFAVFGAYTLYGEKQSSKAQKIYTKEQEQRNL